MQFTGHSLPVHHFVAARWDVHLVPCCQPSSPARFLLITGDWDVSLPLSLEWHVWSSSSGNNCHAVHGSLSSGASLCDGTVRIFFTLSHIVSQAVFYNSNLHTILHKYLMKNYTTIEKTNLIYIKREITFSCLLFVLINSSQIDSLVSVGIIYKSQQNINEHFLPTQIFRQVKRPVGLICLCIHLYSGKSFDNNKKMMSFFFSFLCISVQNKPLFFFHHRIWNNN